MIRCQIDWTTLGFGYYQLIIKDATDAIRDTLVNHLCKSVVEEEEDATGEEFDDSFNVQRDVRLAYDAYTQALRDRNQVLNGTKLAAPRLGPGDESELQTWRRFTRKTDLKVLKGDGIVTSFKALISELKRILDVHGERIREEEREIALRGIREFSAILEAQIKSMTILKKYALCI